MAQLALHGVSKRFGSVLAVDGVDLEIEHGEFVVLVGPLRVRQVHHAAG